jgi:hypothetical protein
VVEHNLAKVGVASSSLVSRSKLSIALRRFIKQISAEWQNGHAAACKAVYAGSIPTSASKNTVSPRLMKYQNPAARKA